MASQLFTCTLVCQLLAVLSTYQGLQLNASQPQFGIPMENLTVAKGRDASFTCIVHNLGSHRVAWIKADDKGIIAMHDRVLTNNARLSVLHNDLQTWTLQIRDVRRSDRGMYMCQINTEPMRHQMAFLEVVIPPDILSEGGSEMLVPEGGSARLSCKVRGFPQPRVTWRREDGQEIVVRNNGAASPKLRVPHYEGEVLVLHKITRSEMGAYLCIATNGVPPSVSRRIVVNVHFYPIIHVPNAVIGGSVGSNVTLECYVEASPKPINYWIRDTGEFIINNDRYRMDETEVNSYTCRLRLHMQIQSYNDEGIYKCASKNSIGDSEGLVQVHVNRQPRKDPATPAWLDNISEEPDGATSLDDGDTRSKWSRDDGDSQGSAEVESYPESSFSENKKMFKEVRNRANPTERLTVVLFPLVIAVVVT